MSLLLMSVLAGAMVLLLECALWLVGGPRPLGMVC